jgi:predicted transposase YbfD/YdcC
MSKHNYITLMDYLAVMPDPRDARGRQYEWPYLMTVATAAMLAGYQTFADMAAWADRHKRELIDWLRPEHKQAPSESTIRRTIIGMDVTLLEDAIAAYLQRLDRDDGVQGTVETQQGERLHGQSADGKTLRTASAYGETVHLVSIVRHESGVALNQSRVTGTLNEAEAAKSLLAGLPLEGTVTTMDALYTQRDLAQQILDEGGHYLMVVKANQPTLYHEIELAFSALPPINSWEQEFWAYERHIQQESGHGRFEYRRLESTTALNHYLNWPGVQRVLRRTRWHQHHRSGQSSQHVRYAICSLGPELLSIDQVEQLWRWHWTIENGNHFRRDVSFGEDRCRSHVDDSAQIRATLRNAMLGLIRLQGWHSIPDAFRYFQRSPQHPLRFLGAIAS